MQHRQESKAGLRAEAIQANKLACAGLVLLPLAVRGNVPGHEIKYPMAIVILGLVTSTLLNLLVLTTLALRYGRFRA